MRKTTTTTTTTTNETKQNKNKTTPEAQTASRSSENFEEKYDTVLTVRSRLKRQNETAC